MSGIQRRTEVKGSEDIILITLLDACHNFVAHAE